METAVTPGRAVGRCRALWPADVDEDMYANKEKL